MIEESFVPSIVAELTVVNVDESITFYQRCFGFSVVDRVPEEGAASWAEVELGSSRLMLQAQDVMVEEIPALSATPIGGTCVLVLRLGHGERVRSLYEAMLSSGRIAMPLRETEYGSVEFGVLDPDGYVVLCAGEN